MNTAYLHEISDLSRLMVERSRELRAALEEQRSIIEIIALQNALDAIADRIKKVRNQIIDEISN